MFGLEQVLKDIGAWDEGWRTSRFGDTLICPCGNEIELDGDCYCGNKSPLKGIGLI